MTTHKKHDTMTIVIMSLLVLNLLFGVYVSFFKRDALWLETLKAGGTANMTMAKQLYTSPAYIQQQKSTLEQILGSMNQAGQQAPAVQSGIQQEPTQVTE